jgi:hypothetical protein
MTYSIGDQQCLVMDERFPLLLTMNPSYVKVFSQHSISRFGQRV